MTQKLHQGQLLQLLALTDTERFDYLKLRNQVSQSLTLASSVDGGINQGIVEYMLKTISDDPVLSFEEKKQVFRDQ